MALSPNEKRELFLKALSLARKRVMNLEEFFKNYSDEDINELMPEDQALLDRLILEDELDGNELYEKKFGLSNAELQEISRKFGLALPEKDMSFYLGSEEGFANPVLQKAIDGLEPDNDFFVGKSSLKDLIQPHPEDELGAELFSQVGTINQIDTMVPRSIIKDFESGDSEADSDSAEENESETLNPSENFKIKQR